MASRLDGTLCRLAALMAALAAAASGHGMLWDPPNRGSLWRFGYDTPINYNDNEQFCGGFKTQWEQNGGRCGECGDDFALARPRPQENGGKFGLAVISATYERASVINATALITANHMGFFSFRLCPLEEEGQLETEECFSQWPLSLTDGSTEYELPSNESGYYSVELQLPEDLECSQCVLQWTYVSGNNWGVCDDGSEGLGCGPQETFRTCSDIAIGGNYTAPSVSWDEDEDVGEDLGEDLGEGLGEHVDENVDENLEENVDENVDENVGENVGEDMGEDEAASASRLI